MQYLEHTYRKRLLCFFWNLNLTELAIFYLLMIIIDLQNFIFQNFIKRSSEHVFLPEVLS